MKLSELGHMVGLASPKSEAEIVTRIYQLMANEATAAEARTKRIAAGPRPAGLGPLDNTKARSYEATPIPETDRATVVAFQPGHWCVIQGGNRLADFGLKLDDARAFAKKWNDEHPATTENKSNEINAVVETYMANGVDRDVAFALARRHRPDLFPELLANAAVKFGYDLLDPGSVSGGNVVRTLGTGTHQGSRTDPTLPRRAGQIRDLVEELMQKQGLDYTAAFVRVRRENPTLFGE